MLRQHFIYLQWRGFMVSSGVNPMRIGFGNVIIPDNAVQFASLYNRCGGAFAPLYPRNIRRGAVAYKIRESEKQRNHSLSDLSTPRLSF